MFLSGCSTLSFSGEPKAIIKCKGFNCCYAINQNFFVCSEETSNQAIIHIKYTNK